MESDRPLVTVKKHANPVLRIAKTNNRARFRAGSDHTAFTEFAEANTVSDL